MEVTSSMALGHTSMENMNAVNNTFCKRLIVLNILNLFSPRKIARQTFIKKENKPYTTAAQQ